MPNFSPLADVERHAGASFAETAGFVLPAHFGEALAEYREAVSGAVVFDQTHHGQLDLRGRDALQFLHNLCTNDILSLRDGDGCEAFLVTAQAKIVDHVIVGRLGDGEEGPHLWLGSSAGMGERVAQHLDRFHISESVEVVDNTGSIVQVHVAGPTAQPILEKALQMDLQALGSLEQWSAEWHRENLRVRRYDRLGLTGFDVACQRREAPILWVKIVEAGAKPAGSDAYEILRIEAGRPVYGVDIDETNLPQEVGRIERTVSFTKGCYIGQETVARIRAYGHVNRSLVGLRLEESAAPPCGAPVVREGQQVGAVTSSAISPRLGCGIALAYVRRGHQDTDTAVAVRFDGILHPGSVAPLPFTPVIARGG
jgi:folate-binding protein YgfZ